MNNEQLLSLKKQQLAELRDEISVIQSRLAYGKIASLTEKYLHKFISGTDDAIYYVTDVTEAYFVGVGIMITDTNLYLNSNDHKYIFQDEEFEILSKDHVVKLINEGLQNIISRME